MLNIDKGPLGPFFEKNVIVNIYVLGFFIK